MRHIILLSGILTIFLTVPSAFAQGLEKRYESALLIPWSSLTDAVVKTVSGESGHLMELTLPNQEIIANDIPIDLSNVKIQVDGNIEHIPNQTEEVHWQGNPLSVSIKINSFEVSQTIEQWIDGIRVRVHLSAMCSGVDLLQSSAALQVGLSWISEGASLKAKVSYIEMSWPLDSWKVDQISCEGPKGFADVVEQELAKQLAEPSRWVPLIKSEIESGLNTKLEETLKAYRNPTPIYSDAQAQLELKLSEVDTITSHGLVIKGLIFAKKFDESDRRFELIPLDVEKAMAGIKTTTPLLLVPGHELSILTKEVASQREVHFNLRSIPNFNDLMRFRLFQFFVWPDLMNYEKSASFPVISKLGPSPKVTYGSHRIYIDGEANSWVYSKRNNKPWRYIDVQTRFSTRILPRIEEGRLKLEIERKDIRSSAQMAPEYVRQFSPRTYLPMSIINIALEKSPAFQKFEMDIPRIKLDGGPEYSAHRMHYLIKDMYIIELRSN